MLETISTIPAHSRPLAQRCQKETAYDVNKGSLVIGNELGSLFWKGDQASLCGNEGAALQRTGRTVSTAEGNASQSQEGKSWPTRAQGGGTGHDTVKCEDAKAGCSQATQNLKHHGYEAGLLL